MAEQAEVGGGMTTSSKSFQSGSDGGWANPTLETYSISVTYRGTFNDIPKGWHCRNMSLSTTLLVNFRILSIITFINYNS